MEATRVRRPQTTSAPATAVPPRAEVTRPVTSPLQTGLMQAGPPAIRLSSEAAAAPSGGPVPQAEQLVKTAGPGDPLQPQVQEALESSIQVDLQPVRVHTDARTAEVVDNLPARAFTYGVHVFLGSRERPTDLALMAHEVTHVVQQQGAPVLQMSTESSASDAYEQEARQTSLAVQRGEQVIVRGRTGGPRVQGLFGFVGDWLANRAWSLLNRLAPDVVPIIHQGVFEWLKEKISSAIETVFNTLMAPVRAVTGVVQSLSAHFSELLTWMREAAAQIARGDCSAITQAIDKIHKVIDGIASPIIERVKHLAKKVGDFFTGLWDRVGAPVWDFLKRVGGAVWEKIQNFGSWIWEKTAPIRNALSRAWKWIKDKLGVGEGPEGQNGILQWIQKKAAAAWDWLKAKIEPIKKPLLIVAGVLVMLSPVGPFIAIGGAVVGLIAGIRWIRQHLSKPDGVVQNRGILQGVIIPGIMNAVRGFTGTLARIAGSIIGKLNNVMGGLGQLVGAVGSSFLRFAVAAVRWIADQFQGLVQWASEKLNGLVDWISRGLERLRVFLQPVLDFLAKVGEVIVDILKLPGLILGKIWHAIPACIRDPFVNFLINHILKHIPIFNQIVGLVKVWSKIKDAAITALKQVFTKGDLTGALKTIFKMVLDVLEIPLDLVTGIFNKAATAIDLIIKDPLGFLKNVLSAVKQGFVQFVGKIGTYLLASVLDWLTGELADANITVPRPFNIGAIFSLVLQVVGLSVENIFSRLEKKMPGVAAKLRKALNFLSGAWEWVSILINEGPGGLWKKLQQKLSDLKDKFIDGLINWIIGNISKKAMAKLLSFLDVTGIMPVINGILAIYRAVQSFIRYLKQILQILNSFLDGLVGLTSGAIDPAANFLEKALGVALTVAIGFLANQAGLSGIGERIQEIVEAVRTKVEEAIDWLIDTALKTGRAILDRLGVGGGTSTEEVWFSAEGERHHLFMRRMGTDTVIMIATTEQPASEQLENFKERIPTDIPVASDRETARKRIEEAKTKLGEWNSRANRPDPGTVEYLNQLAEIMQPLYAIFGHPDVPETVVQFTPALSPRGVKGKYVLAQPLTKKAGDVKGSSDTSAHVPGEDRMVSMNKVSINWVKLHLLHFKLHGPNDSRNFAPGTQRSNQEMYDVEQQVIETLDSSEGREVLWYEVDVTYRTDEDADFPEMIKIRHGKFDPKTNTRTSTKVESPIFVSPPGEGISFASLSYDGRIRLEKIGKLPRSLAEAIAQGRKGRGGRPFESPEDVVEAILFYQRTLAPDENITDIIVARIKDSSLVIK